MIFEVREPLVKVPPPLRNFGHATPIPIPLV